MITKYVVMSNSPKVEDEEEAMWGQYNSQEEAEKKLLMHKAWVNDSRYEFWIEKHEYRKFGEI